MDVSPAKRRVLGSLDVNTSSPASSLKLPSKPSKTAGTGPQPESKKRPLAMSSSGAEQPAKKPCPGSPSLAHDHHVPTEQLSPAPSSVFDSSALDTTQGTAVTEPDNDVPMPMPMPMPVPVLAALPAPRRVPTREESRQKAEILRLRLGLATYKLRTGQADVQFAQLRMLGPDGAPLPLATARPAPPASSTGTGAAAAGPGRKRTPLPSGPRPGGLVRRDSSRTSSSRSEEEDEEEDEEEGMDVRDRGRDRGGAATAAAAASPEKPLPRMGPAAAYTPRRRYEDEERLTSSALRGGAASGLLSLSLAGR